MPIWISHYFQNLKKVKSNIQLHRALLFHTVFNFCLNDPCDVPQTQYPTVKSFIVMARSAPFAHYCSIVTLCLSVGV